MKYKFYIIAFVLLYGFSMDAQAQIIVTVAGNGISGYIGDGEPALDAEFNWPNAVAVDTAGNMYIADLDNNVIREVYASGFVTTFAGNSIIGYVGDGFNAAVARFNYPTDVALDKKGNLYIADQFNRVVRKVDITSNIISTYAGYQAYSDPYDPGTGTYSGDNGPATNAQFYRPSSIAFDPAGNLYISDIGNSVVRKVDTLGIITTVAGMNLDTGYTGDGGAATAAKLFQPTGITVDASGNLFIADQYNNVVRKVNTAGIISTVAGNGYHNGSADHSGGYTGDGGQATTAELSLPSDVAVDAAGNLYIADEYNMVVRMVNTSGVITTVAGNGSAGYSGDWGSAKSAKLNFPQGVTIDQSGNLLIADLNNNVVRKVNTGTTGVSEVQAASNNLQLILNPNQGVFFVKGNMGATGQDVSLEVMDMQGQSVYKNTITAQNGTINTQVTLNNDLPNGMYMLRVSTGSETNVSRFVLEK